MPIRSQHPLAGKTVKLNVRLSSNSRLDDELAGQDYRIEDWWQNVAGESWMNSNGNLAALKYAMRSGFNGLPTDNEVVYGKVGAFGHLVHVSELGQEVPDAD